MWIHLIQVSFRVQSHASFRVESFLRPMFSGSRHAHEPLALHCGSLICLMYRSAFFCFSVQRLLHYRTPKPPAITPSCHNLHNTALLALDSPRDEPKFRTCMIAPAAVVVQKQQPWQEQDSYAKGRTMSTMPSVHRHCKCNYES